MTASSRYTSCFTEKSCSADFRSLFRSSIYKFNFDSNNFLYEYEKWLLCTNSIMNTMVQMIKKCLLNNCVTFNKYFKLLFKKKYGTATRWKLICIYAPLLLLLCHWLIPVHFEESSLILLFDPPFFVKIITNILSILQYL